MKDAIFEWSVTERRAGRHSTDWYIAAGMVALSLVATAIVLENILFAVLVVISAGVLFLRTLQSPHGVRYALTSRGLYIDGNFTQYDALESFSIKEGNGAGKLLIKPTSFFSPLFTIPLRGVDRGALHDHLSSVLREAELHEPLSKRIMEFLGF